MPDRSPEERAAARRERELRRAAREGRAPIDRAPVEPARSKPPASESPPPAARPPAGPTPADLKPAADRDPAQPAPADPARDDPKPARATPALPEPYVAEPAPGQPIAADLAAAGSPRVGAAARAAGQAGPPAETPGEPAEGAGDYNFETGEHEFEAPAGTRRVSHQQTARGGRTRTRSPRGRAGSARGRGRGDGPETAGRSWRGRIGAVIALAVAAVLIWFLNALFEPFHGSGTGRITLVIPTKSASGQIGDLLARDGVIDSSFFFQLRATLAGERGSLRSGVYHLQHGMSYGAVLTALTKAPPAAKVATLTITEGRTRQYVSGRLRTQHLGTNYLAATRRSALINWRSYGLRNAPPTLEGFLFPDTYQLVTPIRVSALVQDQVTAFKSNFAKVNLGYARRKRLTPYDVVTIASMVEAEASSPRDRPLVASVVYNRLAAGMLLQFDSTTRYATGNFTGPITVSQLHSRSRWNTHVHLGLPPTPIDSPGLAALQAAAHPAQTNYLFFFARKCGRGTDFTATYSKFLDDAAKDAKHHC